jgi:hypothetical protein
LIEGASSKITLTYAMQMQLVAESKVADQPVQCVWQRRFEHERKRLALGAAA